MINMINEENHKINIHRGIHTLPEYIRYSHNPISIPDYEKIIPRVTRTKVEVPVDHLGIATKRVSLFAKENNNIVGWATRIKAPFYAIGDPSICKNKTALVCMFVKTEHRNKGYGYEIGKVLFKMVKEEGWKRIVMSFWTSGSTKTYKKLSNFLNVKKAPYSLPHTINKKTGWKLITL